MTNSMRSCDQPRGERRSRKVDPLSPIPMQYAADPGHAARLGARLTDDLASGGVGADLRNSILEASVDCIKVLDLDGTLHAMNEKGRLVMEIDDFGEVRGLPWIDFWSPDQQPAVAEALAAARSGSTGRFAGYRPTAKGTPKW